MFEEMIKSRIEPGNHALSLPKATSTLGSLRILNDDQSSVLIPRTDEKPVEDLQRVHQEKTNGSYKTLQDNDHSPALNTKMDENCKDNVHRGDHHKEWVKHLHLKKPDYT
nr:pentatricopeptide repeat-containing protein At5g21222-like [Ipomoea batatas]GME06436.1 pentatricopeptide repeat-containing protein At5g21222-like [Ipomoea batatas]GME06437.1 pentatricopeptide repeat-containing protein At5g21222-like [Ipomoea batatas]GME13805.1 pentatricopeptide repeat-containing protein At5g21222-like [Ipomoea batatas]